VLKVRRRGETFYRVRVGHYASLEEAQQSCRGCGASRASRRRSSPPIELR
jgi:hypothetical protein